MYWNDMTSSKILFFSILFLLISLSLTAQQNGSVNSEAIQAVEEFRWGVISFHEGLFNKSILSLEKSLALDPDNFRTRFWLGRSYYQSGFEEAALNEWQNLINHDKADSALISFAEIVSDRRGLSRELKSSDRLVELYDIPREQDGLTFYNRPVSVSASPDGDGSFYLLSYLNGDLLKISTTGRINHVLSGGVLGFDKPFDLDFLPDDQLLVSEYGADRVSICSRSGFRIKSIGERGTGDGQLLGPQYLAVSEDGYIYVTEWGNRRVSKFNLEGEFILSFGRPRSDFSGLRGPSGLVLRNGLVYVADSMNGRVEVFDESGNFIQTLIREGLKAPEDLLFVDDDSLLIADEGQILVYDLVNDVLSVSSDLGGSGKRVLSITQDGNGNIVAADFDGNSVSVMTDLATLYAGLFLRINRIATEEYPLLHVDFTVEDRWGKAVVGLDQKNFFLRENDQTIEGFDLSYTGYNNNDLIVSVLVDNNRALRDRKNLIQDGIRSIFKDLETGDDAYLVSIKDSPQLLLEPGDSLVDVLPLLSSGWSDHPDIASGLRLGASQLIPNRKRKIMIFLTDGRIHPETFVEYGLQDMAQYMSNNGIRFYPVYLDPDYRNPELDYIARETGGNSAYLLQPRGILPLMEDARSGGNGFYTISYNAISNTNFGQSYIPITLEVNYVRKSGRDELGYFGPLEY
ncbi:MAG: hypothetical protein B6241_09835 [Spirochaetaceae bacterium 4572_59]|nr:MAG: hypothetical protein B6241_09835 [Spirochaetaceae bacterium 4572_59]